MEDKKDRGTEDIVPETEYHRGNQKYEITIN